MTAMATIPTKIKNRIDTIENWDIYDPVLLSGEIGVVGNVDNSVPNMKVGDGVHPFSQLPYLVPTSISAFTNDSGYAKGFTTETISNTNGHYLLKNGKVNLVELSTELSTTWTEVGNTMWEGTQTESQLDSSTWPVWDTEIGKWTMDGITPGFDGFTSGTLSSKGGNQRSSTLNFETVLSCTRDMEIHVDLDALSAYVTFNLSSPVQSTTTYDPEDGSVKEITFEFYDFADTPDKLHKAKVALEEAADSVISQARLKTTMVERELFIHDYICQNTVYDEAAPYNQSAYSCLVMHKSVCAGYARAFQYLMQKAGFTCYYVAGRTEGLNGQVMNGSNESGSHSWNMVLLDGEYYNVDCLWDDTASDTYGSAIYPFFNLTDEAFRYHTRISMAVGLPKCNGTKYKYSNYFGKTVEAESIVFVDEE